MMMTTDRKGNWIQTYTGRQFWPLDPRADEIDVIDIAHALSMQCRYAGHCLEFYSVAEHSVLVSRSLPPELRLWGLLHDASEAYLIDVPRPIKPYLRGYVEMEDRVMEEVAERYNLDRPHRGYIPTLVKMADARILVDERLQNMSRTHHVWSSDRLEPLGVKLECWWPLRAKAEFLDAFYTYTTIAAKA